MTKQISKTQDNTELSTFTPDENMLIWRDISIQIRKLSPLDIANSCGEIYTNKKPETWRQLYYKKWLPIEGFKQWWLGEYAAHFKNELGAKSYARLHDRVDLEKDMSKIIQVLEHVEGKKDNPVAVQVNNIIGAKKQEYDI